MLDPLFHNHDGARNQSGNILGGASPDPIVDFGVAHETNHHQIEMVIPGIIHDRLLPLKQQLNDQDNY